jgi:hypothetical protein
MMPRRPRRLQRKRTKGWRMPEGAVYVGRPTVWGNPFDFRREVYCWTALAHGFRADRAGRLAASIAIYRAWLIGGRAGVAAGGLGAEGPGGAVAVVLSPVITAPAPPTLAEIRAALAGRDLVCWCPLDQACHADVLLEIANRPPAAGCCDPHHRF